MSGTVDMARGGEKACGLLVGILARQELSGDLRVT
jgi:hypothetical protein